MLNVFGVVITAGLFFQSAQAEQKCAIPREAVDEGFFESIYKPLQQSKLTDVKKFCRFAMGQRFLETQKGINADRSLDIMSSPDYEKELNNIASLEADQRDSWQNSLIPSQAMRQKSFSSQSLPGDFGKSSNLSLLQPTKEAAEARAVADIEDFNSTKAELRKLMNTPAEKVKKDSPQWWSWKEEGRRSASEPSKNVTFRKSTKINNAILEVAKVKSCADLTIKHLIGCKESFDGVMESGLDGEGGVSDLMREFLSNPKYDEPIGKATLKILDRLEQDPTKSSKGNIMTDLVDSFKESGWSKKDATDSAWKVMGLFGAAGPNLNSYLSKYAISTDNMHTQLGLGTIATALPLLDMKYNNEAGHLYSLPDGVQSSCDGKPSYHFWMAAYQARLQTLKTQSPVGAASSVFAAGKGYQIMGTLGTSRTQGNVFTHSLFSPVQDAVRMDLSFEAAGAAYGAASGMGKNLSLNVDDVLRSMSAAAKYTPALNQEQAKDLYSGTGYRAYSHWHDVFNPDATAVDLFNKLDQ